jgi:preprotein translocase subunit SecF
MDLLRDTRIDFMKYRKFWIVVSLALVAVGIFSVFVHGKLNIGIDFAGGTQLTVKFRERPQVQEIRGLLAGAGLADAQIQRFGEEGDNEIIIKTTVVEGSEEGSRDRVVQALAARYGGGGEALDLNGVGVEGLTAALARWDPDRVAPDEEARRAHYGAVAEAILEARRERGLLTSWDEVAAAPRPGGAEPEAAPGVSPAAAAALRQNARLGDFAVLGVENVGPQIGEELRTKGVLAVVLSLVGMLVYIWIRFELRFGIGALMASLHDVLVCLGLFALLGFEFNLTTIAAFLTLVGYSVNDTVVVFDRVRENMGKNRRMPLLEVMNLSINQTLSRTLLTSGTTLLAVASLLVFGGDVLRGFAFVMSVGVVVGTYSTIYIASAFTLLWEQLFPSAAGTRRTAPRPASSTKGV